MIVYIVMKNGEVDQVFSDLVAAENHVKNLTKLWALTKIIERVVNEF